MPTAPVVQPAVTGAPFASYPFARPLSQSMTALVPSVSAWSPLVGQPSRVAGADALAEHHRVAAGHVVVVQRAGQVGLRLGPLCAGVERAAPGAVGQAVLRQVVDQHARVRARHPRCPCGTGCARR